MPDFFEAVCVDAEADRWVVRNQTKGQNLLGEYSEIAAYRTARRLNANIDLSPNELRAMKLVAILGTATYYQIGLEYRGKKSKNPYGVTESGKSVAEKLAAHQLATVSEQNQSATVTAWGIEWLGLSPRLN